MSGKGKSEGEVHSQGSPVSYSRLVPAECTENQRTPTGTVKFCSLKKKILLALNSEKLL